MRKITPFCGLLLLAFEVVGQAQESAPAALPRTAAPESATRLFPIARERRHGDVTVHDSLRFAWHGSRAGGRHEPEHGHHHLLIDVATLPPDNLPIPNDANHRHFGLGQTETELTLPPGQHTLQLVLGDALHIPHQPPVRSEKITITVTQ